MGGRVGGVLTEASGRWGWGSGRKLSGGIASLVPPVTGEDSDRGVSAHSWPWDLRAKEPGPLPGASGNRCVKAAPGNPALGSPFLGG